MHVAVIGTGYVGLVVGTCLAEVGNDVACVDVVADKIARLNEGEIPIYEPGLELLVRQNLSQGRLRFGTDVPEAVRFAEVIFIAVGTPPDEDGSADLQHVLAVAETIGKSMDGEKIVITKSTVPVGTAAKVRSEIEKHTEHPVHVCSNPEFLEEGAARRMLGDSIELVDVNYDALKDADALVIHTEWLPYRRPDFGRMRGLMAQPIVFDGRNLYSLDRMAEAGFEYYSVGRPAVGAPSKD